MTSPDIDRQTATTTTRLPAETLFNILPADGTPMQVRSAGQTMWLRQSPAHDSIEQVDDTGTVHATTPLHGGRSVSVTVPPHRPWISR